MANNDLYPSTSPYNQTSIVDGNYLDVMITRPIPLDPTDVEYIVPPVYEFRPDMLAYDMYGDSRLWWVIAARNPNVLGPDPYFNLIAGIKIYLPKLSTLKNVLGI